MERIVDNGSQKVVKSFFWKLLERGATQVLSLVIQILLARIIAPDDFGIIAILLVFINLANVFIQKGFSSALIRKKEVNDVDYNTAFLVSELLAFLLSVLIFFLAPIIQKIYFIDGIAVGLRLLTISLIFGALYSVQNAYLVRNMKFRSIFIRSLIATILSGAIGLFMAFKGYGFYAIVVQTITQQVVLCTVSFFAVSWKPRFRFSWNSFVGLFSFGSKVLITELISSIVDDIRTLFIGKKNDTTDLAFYDRGQIYPATFMRCIYDSISSVMLPVFSEEHNSGSDITEPVQNTFIVSLFWSCPIFIGLAAISNEFVSVILTDKWLPCVPFLIVFCIYQLAFPVYGITRQGFYALGKSGIVLIIEIVKAVLFLASIFVGLQYSPFMICILSCVSMYLTMFLYFAISCKFFKYNFKFLLWEIGKIIIGNACMYLSVYLFNLLGVPNYAKLIIDIIIGAIIYLGVTYLLKSTPIKGLITLLKVKKEKKNGNF